MAANNQRTNFGMKIGIVGSGMVGTSAAYALIMRGIGRQIVLVDLNRKRAEAEAADLMHAVPFANPLEIQAGEYSDLEGARVVVIAAGVGQKPGETRLELLARNAKIFQSVIPQVVKYAPDAVLLIATNPVDVMTHLSAQYAAELGVPSSRVIGTGTTLDTARFRSLLGKHVGVDPQHVHGYVIGEHGDSEVFTWSLTTVGVQPLDEFCRQRKLVFDQKFRADVEQNVRKAAYHIIEGKGATYYGIGSAIARIVEVILADQRAILTVCTPMPSIAGVNNVTVALPHLVGGNGILATFPQPLNTEEEALLRNSAQIIRDAISGVEALN